MNSGRAKVGPCSVAAAASAAHAAVMAVAVSACQVSVPTIVSMRQDCAVRVDRRPRAGGHDGRVEGHRDGVAARRIDADGEGRAALDAGRRHVVGERRAVLRGVRGDDAPGKLLVLRVLVVEQADKPLAALVLVVAVLGDPELLGSPEGVVAEL